MAIEMTAAAGALADHFGARLEVERAEGRRLMADALHQQFAIPIREARQVVEALEHAGTIRWITRRAETDPRITTSSSMPVTGIVRAEGYWQLEPA